MPAGTPKSPWLSGDVLAGTDLNTELRDQLIALFTPPQAHIVRAAIYTTTTTWADIDSTNLKLLITPLRANATLRIDLQIPLSHSAGGYAQIGFTVDGTRYSNVNGLFQVNPAPAAPTVYSLYRDITGLSAAQHDIRVQWQTGSATLTADGGAYPILFDVIEIGLP